MATKITSWQRHRPAGRLLECCTAAINLVGHVVADSYQCNVTVFVCAFMSCDLFPNPQSLIPLTLVTLRFSSMSPPDFYIICSVICISVIFSCHFNKHAYLPHQNTNDLFNYVTEEKIRTEKSRPTRTVWQQTILLPKRQTAIPSSNPQL